MIELEFWDFVTFTHCSIQIFPLYLIFFKKGETKSELHGA